MPGIVATNAGGKACKFGLEYASAQIWKNWEPGREYVKNVVLKNVQSKVLRLKYKLPTSQFFVTLFPQSIVLPPGTSHTLPVTFRPLEKTQYNDFIEILTNEGHFSISLQGVLPEIVVDIPNEVNFGMCAVGDQLTTSFDVKNLSEEVTDFEIDCSPLFNIDPVRGRLEPMSSVTITTAFKPTTAVAFTGTAVIRYGKELLSEKTMNLTAIGKYAHLVASGNGSPSVGCNCAVDFGNVPVGKDAERWIDLKNYSPVNAIFHIEPQAPSDGVFAFMQRDGIVPAGSSLRIPIRFHPQIVNKKYNDYFNIYIKGSTAKTVVACTGSCKGPLVTISERVLSFGCTKAGYSVKRTVTLSNEANMDAAYQFQIDCSQSPFKLSPSQGVLPAQGTQTIIVSFEPSHPINYYRQVACLILHQFPISLELIGTCHSDTQKPAILQHKHVLNYQKVANSDISFHPPEVIGEWIQQGKITLDSEGRFQMMRLQTQTTLLEHENMMDHYFNDGYHSDVVYSLPHVSLDMNELHFGGSSVKEKVVSVTNHTKGKVTVVWLTDDNAIFTVTPQTCDILPEQAATVSVRFKPAREGQFYGAQLEGYAYYTCLRDNRLVPEGTLCPPWCLNLTVTGNTFPANVEHFVPHCEFDSSSIALDAVAPNQVSYQTVMLTNNGSTPILFEIDREKLDNVIGVKPTRGYIEVNQHQVFVVKLALTDVNLYHQIVYFKLNDSVKNTQELIVSGTSELPDLLLDNNGQMFFKPTCVGSTSPQFVGVRNISHYPVTFEWKMHSTDQQLLAVEPSSGIIQPNEKQFHKWSFKPDKEDKFVMKPSIIVRQLKSPSGEAALFTLKAVGEGTRGKLLCESVYQDFGTVIVGSLAYRPITIVNDNDCGVHYQLSIEQKEEGPYKAEELQKDRCVLVLDNASGYLPAHSRCFVHASCRPIRRVNYQWDVSYQLVSSDGNLISETFHLCHLLATGVYPLMSVVDVHSGGSAKTLSKRQVWNLLSIDHFNKCLEGDPTLSELTLFQEKDLPTRAMVEFNFSAAPVGSEPSVMEIVFQNTGHAACEWAFLFPNDLEMDVEYWAETSDFTDEQLHQLKIMDNKLFFVQPRRGRLEIGETVSITLTYKHEMPSTDKLPLLLKLSQGREILLNLVGVTVELSRHYAHFARLQHTFSPTEIGLKPSPVQVYELYNGGALPIKYFIDVEPLEQLRHENFDHSIFECLNLTGEIKPGSTANIEWIFSPLEAKMYSVDVPIRIEHAEVTTVTFTGVGYDRRILGDAKPAETGLVIPAKKTSVPADKNKLCVLSEECIALGDVPLFTKIRRYVTVTNQSTTHGANFKWYLTTSQDSKYVTVTPPLGTIPPGQSVQCKVTFVSCGAPTFYNIYIICEVTNLTEYAKYEAALLAWEQEQVRQRTEFTITEQTMKQEAMNGSADNFSSSRSLQSSDLNARYKKALPPIGNGTSEQESPGRKKRTNRLVWNKPQPPTVMLLHVAVVAQTHSLPEYQQHNLTEYKSYFIDRSIQSNITTPSIREPGKVRCLTAEADVVGETLASIIRSLLDDPTFHDAAQKATNEQIPYYQQLTRPKQASEDDEQALPVANDRATLSSPDAEREQQRSVSAASATTSTERPSKVHEVSSSAPEVNGSHQHSDRQVDTLSRTSQGRRSTTSSKMLSTRAESSKDKNKAKTAEEMSSQNFAQNQLLKQNAVFGSLIESVVENALTNVLEEAFRGEFNIASRPRLVALLPKSKAGPASLN